MEDMRQAYRESAFSCEREGLTIRGTEYRPAGERLPIAIVSHGFGANQESTRGYAKQLAGWGFLAYCFDFCGGCVEGSSDGKTRDMSVFTEVKDLEAALGYAREREYSDENRVVLMGCSQGGFVSALAAAKGENRVGKIVLFYPALCIPDDARRGKMIFAEFDPQNIPEEVPCGPMLLGRHYIADVIELNPYDLLAPFAGDVLLVHGTGDDLVDVRYSREAFARYREETGKRGLDRQVVLQEIAGGAHGFSEEHDVLAMGYVEKFLRGE